MWPTCSTGKGSSTRSRLTAVKAISCLADISSAADNDALAAAAADAFGTIDVLINNAAYYSAITRGPFNEVSQQEWDRTFEINVRGAWLTCCAVYPYMRTQGSGKIINISSTTCFKGTVGFPPLRCEQERDHRLDPLPGPGARPGRNNCQHRVP